MTGANAKRTVHFWKEILPLVILAVLLFYFSVTWNPVLIGLIFVPVLLAAIVFFPEKLWWMVIAWVPFSVDLELYADTPVGMYLPTEPVLAGFLLLSVMYLFRYPPDRSFLRHPVIMLLTGYFGWTALSVITSQHPVASLKSFVVQMWFVVPVLLLGERILTAKDQRKRFFRVYVFSFSIVVIYTLIRLAMHGFPIKEAEWLMRPFFKDHTLMGAVLGLTMPYVGLKIFEKNTSARQRMGWVILFAIYTVVLIETHSRAALLSLIVAAALYFCIFLRIKFAHLTGALILVSGLIWFYQAPLMNSLERNEAESRGDFIRNMESISNVSTDASNLERINRWNAAIEMWKDRPVFGWGPGTYQFEYAPFQKSADLTIISTNVGDVGNAHSEYLGALSESGLAAMIFLVLFVVVTIRDGYRTVLDLTGQDRLILMSALLGFVTYFTHGVLNNFLHSDKVSVFLWGCVAVIVHYSLERKKRNRRN